MCSASKSIRRYNFFLHTLKMSRLLNYSRPIEPLVSRYLLKLKQTISQKTFCRKSGQYIRIFESSFFFFFLEIDLQQIIRVLAQSDWITKKLSFKQED